MSGAGGFLAARFRSFGFALSGLAFMLRTQGNARLHLVATVAVAGLGAWLGLDAGDWLWLVAAVALVWIAEALNTAIEHLCDVVSPERNGDVRRAKDVAAGAVFLAAIAAAAIGALVFWPYLDRYAF
jgi:diacylglycerol kinase (ATP)